MIEEDAVDSAAARSEILVKSGAKTHGTVVPTPTFDSRVAER